MTKKEWKMENPIINKHFSVTDNPQFKKGNKRKTFADILQEVVKKPAYVEKPTKKGGKRSYNNNINK